MEGVSRSVIAGLSWRKLTGKYTEMEDSDFLTSPRTRSQSKCEGIDTSPKSAGRENDGSNEYDVKLGNGRMLTRVKSVRDVVGTKFGTIRQVSL